MFAMLQVIGVLILLGILIVFFRKFIKRPPVVVLGLCITLVIAAVFSAGLLATIPMATEEITVSVISDKNLDSTGSEIILSSVISDGKIYHMSEPVEGRWIDEQNGYRWSELSEATEAEGITRSVIFDVPIGGGRNLVFVGGPDCGKVEVSYNGSTNIYDLYRSEVREVKVPFESTNEVYDNVIKILRLALFGVLIILIMIFPVLAVYKYTFKSCDYFFTNAIKTIADIYRNHKIECILCLISTILSYCTFLYMDINSLTAWSIENMDAFFRGGFNGFMEIRMQDLWQPYHKTSAVSFSFSDLFWGIWNLPLLLIHYLFKTEHELTPSIMMWSKVFLELLVIGVAYITQKIVEVVTQNKERSMLAFILAVGSVTVFFCVGYSGQDDIFYMFFLLISLYDFLIGKKNRAMIWMAITLYQCPLMIIFTAIIIISLTEKLYEMVVRLGINLAMVLISMRFYIGSESTSQTQINLIFGRTLLPDANGSFSVFALIVIFLCLYQFCVKQTSELEKKRSMLYALSITSISFLLFSFTHIQRYLICMIFIIICLVCIENSKVLNSSLLGLCIFEYGLTALVTSIHNNYFNFLWINPILKKSLGSEEVPNISLFNYLKINNPEISNYFPIIHGMVFAAGIWILLCCNPKTKDTFNSKIVCLIPIKVMTSIFISSTIILICVMCAIVYQIDYINVGYSNNMTEAITGNNYVEEYYKGKSADWVQIVFRPVTNGRSYPQSQMLNLDIIDAETGEIVGSGSCSASEFKDKSNYTLKIDDVDINKDKWYIFRYYSPKVIENEENYMYLLYSNAGTSDPDCHYALVKNGTNDSDEYIPANYDIGGEILLS